MRRSIYGVAVAALAALSGASMPLPPGLQLKAAMAAAPTSLITPIATTARDEMLIDSSGQRQHWTAVPELVVVTSVLQFHTGNPGDYVAVSEQLNAEETRSLVNDLTLALGVLTNDTLTQFSSIRYETVPAGASVNVIRPKQIVVGRYQGVRELAHTLGFGGRSARHGGVINAAAVMLDSEFDRTSSMRRLLRTHELGHALGFNHVESRVSIMNPRIGPEVNALDRQIASWQFSAIGGVAR